VDRFKAATQDGFFLCVEARDPLFDARRTRETIEDLDPVSVWELDQ